MLEHPSWGRNTGFFLRVEGHGKGEGKRGKGRGVREEGQEKGERHMTKVKKTPNSKFCVTDTGQTNI